MIAPPPAAPKRNVALPIIHLTPLVSVVDTMSSFWRKNSRVVLREGALVLLSHAVAFPPIFFQTVFRSM